MKKLIFTLGWLACGGNIAYGMNQTVTHTGITIKVNTDLARAIGYADWPEVIRILKATANDATAGLQLDSTDPDILNVQNNKGEFLLSTLLFHSTDEEKDPCRLTLELLINNNRLDITRTGAGRGRDANTLVCNHHCLENDHKERFVTLLTKNNIPNPFTQTNDAHGKIIFTLKQQPLLPFSVTNYKLWIAVTATLTIAAVGIYKWYTKKAAAADDDDDDDDETDEEGEQPAETTAEQKLAT